jgi:uncharacterized protein (TIGR00106 family)
MELSMFPADKGESLSGYVSRVIEMIGDSGVDHQVTPMGTVIETDDVQKALAMIADAYKQLEPDCNRVIATIKLDIRKGKKGRLHGKIESIEQKLGKKVKT